MPRRFFLLASVGLCICAAILGCNSANALNAKNQDGAIRISPQVEGTVAQYADLVTGDIAVQGYGLVVGLGNNGSSAVPSHLQKYMKEYLAKQNLGSWTAGTEMVTPSRILRDLDTATILSGGAYPHGAPVGSQFDVNVSALPQTQTRSLDGGILMPTDLRLAVGGKASVEGPTMRLAEVSGPIFVNPFLDSSNPTEQAKSRIGRIIGGGRVIRAKPIRLQLRKPEYERCRLIDQMINKSVKEWYPLEKHEKVAKAKNPSTIEITIPQAARDDYEHFLKLILHIPLRGGPGQWEKQARKIAVTMEQPSANHDGLAFVWEAMGRQTVPVLQTLYTSKHPEASFYSARTGLRLGDEVALDVVRRFATTANSPLQLPAIEELGKARKFPQSASSLKKLLDDENVLIRIAAYEALTKLGDKSRIRRIDVDGQFKLDLVNSSRDYVVYATQTKEPKIVLFGKDMNICRPLFFNPPDDLITINARKNDDKIMLFRKIQRTNSLSDPFFIDFKVSSLIQTLGSRPVRGENGQRLGLGLTYGQVIGVLHRMCRENDILAKFVLQPLPEVQKIYRSTTTVGRPDMPGP